MDLCTANVARTTGQGAPQMTSTASDITPDVRRKLGGLNLQSLRTFQTVAEHNSFSRAASLLNVSQPTVSFQISNMESLFGITLFHRRPRLELTTVGRELLNRTRIILSRIDDLEVSLDELQMLQRGQLSLGFSAPRRALVLVARFMQAYPAIEVRTIAANTHELVEHLEQYRIDMAVVGLLEPLENIGCQLIEPIRLSVWLPKDHPLAGRPSLGLEEVASLPLVLREQGSVTRSAFERACIKRDIKPQVRLQVHGREAVREAVAAGIGVGVIFNTEAAHDDRIRHVPIVNPSITAGTYLIYLNEMLGLPAVQAMLDLAAGAPGSAD